MGTRCNIQIKMPEWEEQLTYNLPSGEKATRHHPEQNMWVYRHYDGYPEETGADLLCLADILLTQDQRSIRTIEDAYKMLNGMSVTRDLNYRISNPSSIPYSLGRYQKTDQQHGDIEWVYTVMISPPQSSVRSIFVKTEEVSWRDGTRKFFSNHHYRNCGPRFPNQIADYLIGGTDLSPAYKDEASRRSLSSTTTGEEE